MDPLQLSVYQRQVAFSCKAVLLGWEDMQGPDALQSGRFWYGAQNLIVGAGNASKALWGSGKPAERIRRYSERKPLRDSLNVTDKSPLRHVEIRNDYEHLDERIELWWCQSRNPNMLEELIGPRDALVREGLGDKDTLRWFDPASGDLIFWGN